jgi:hypothetical protein
MTKQSRCALYLLVLPVFGKKATEFLLPLGSFFVVQSE